MCTVFKSLSIHFAHKRIVLHDQALAQCNKKLDELKDYLARLDVLSCRGVDVDEAKVSTIRAIKAVEKDIAKFKESRSKIFKKYLNKRILKREDMKDDE